MNPQTTETNPSFVPLCVPSIQGNAWEYIKECLDTGWVSSVGTYVDQFERIVARRVDADYAVATSCGTAALHVALLVAGVEPDDEVLLPSVTFIAPANAIRYCGAWPIFIDSDPIYWQIDTEKISNFLLKECEWRHGHCHNRVTERRVKALLPVHVLGHPCDLDTINSLAQKYALTVIEDASESLGAQYKGYPIGGGENIVCFSFNGNKIATTGGGGMITTNHREWAERAKHLTTQAKIDQIEYIHDEIGYNYRLTNILAALGCSQIELLDSFISCKKRIAAMYRKAFAELEQVTCMPTAEWADSIEWLFTIHISGLDHEKRRWFIKEMGQRNIQVRPLWKPLHQLPLYAQAQCSDLEVANKLYESSISLPCSTGLTECDQIRVIDSVRELVEKS